MRPARLPIILILAGLVPLALASCSEIVAPQEDFEPAILVFGDQGPVFSVPDTVPRGLAFAMVVQSYGDGCVTQGDMRVNLEGRQIRLEPLDLHSGGEACSRVFRIFEHRATLAVNESRTYEVRIDGWAQPGDTAVVLMDTLVVR
jgi:hypothetical protein